MKPHENYEVTCPDCGSTFRGAAVAKLSRGLRETYRRVPEGVAELARCLCADREKPPALPVLVSVDPTVFIARSRGAYSTGVYLLRAVRATKATVFALPVSWNSDREVQFSVARASSADYGTTDEELRHAVRGLPAAQKPAPAQKPTRRKS